jgi:ribosomal protein L22
MAHEYVIDISGTGGPGRSIHTAKKSIAREALDPYLAVATVTKVLTNAENNGEAHHTTDKNVKIDVFWQLED